MMIRCSCCDLGLQLKPGTHTVPQLQYNSPRHLLEHYTVLLVVLHQVLGIPVVWVTGV